MVKRWLAYGYRFSMIKITMHPDHSFFLLSEKERKGLDIDRTRRLFKEAIMRFLPEAVFEYRDDCPEQCLEITGDSILLNDGSILLNDDNAKSIVSDFFRHLFINLEWLTYMSSDAHCDALVNNPRQATINHIICMPGLMLEKYSDKSRRELFYLPMVRRDRRIWDNLDLVTL